MKYSYYFNPRSLKQLKKLDKPIQMLIINWLDKYIQNAENPRLYGKSLTADRSDEWRYRIGDYRILAHIRDEIVEIEIIQVGHRRYVYDR